MIEINLLPHREAKRVADLRDSVGLLVLGLVLVMGGIWFADSGIEAEIEKNEASVRQLKAKAGKDIWLFGGGELFRSLLEAGLVVVELVDEVVAVIAALAQSAGGRDV